MEESNWKENFEKLSTKEQLATLQGCFNIISERIQNQLAIGAREGNIDVIDIAYNKLDGDKIVFDVTIVDKSTGEYLHEFYNDDLDKIDINFDKINKEKENLNSLKALGGYDTTEMEQQLAEKEKQAHDMANLKDNPDKISLSKLKEIDKEIENTADSFGISKDSILSYASLDANYNLKVNESAIKGSSFQDINATEKVSVNYNMRDVLGGNFVRYKIIKTTNGNYKLFGIDAEGNATEFTQDQVELISDTQAITLTQENGNTMQSNMIVGFRVKDKVSSVNNDQIVGLCTDETSRLTCFYGRGASTDNIVAENIPANTYTNGPKSKNILFDTQRTDINEFSKVTEIINSEAEKHNIDLETLREEVLKQFPNYDNVTYEKICDIASDIERAEPGYQPERILNPNQHS